MDLGHVLETAHTALPRIELFAGLGTDAITVGAMLDDVWLDPLGHPVPTDGETDLGRWVGLGGCAIMVDDHGGPVAGTGAMSGQLLPLINGGGLSLLLTEDRLIGSFLVGKVGGSVALRRGDALAFSYPLRFVDAVGIRTRTTMLGKVKDTGLVVHTLGPPAVATVTIDPDASLAYPSLNATKHVDVPEATRQLLHAIAVERQVGVPEMQNEDGEPVAYFPERGTPNG